MRKGSLRLAVMPGSSWRSEPAAALRGLMNSLSFFPPLLLVQVFEIGFQHQHFPADFDKSGSGSVMRISLEL